MAIGLGHGQSIRQKAWCPCAVHEDDVFGLIGTEDLGDCQKRDSIHPGSLNNEEKITVKKRLVTDVEGLRNDFESVRGEPFKHYYCPILHVDEKTPLCYGHVVPKSVGGQETVIQREDVDNGFGFFFEAEARDAIRHGLERDGLLQKSISGDPDEVKEIHRRFKINTIFCPGDKPIRVNARKVNGETLFFVKREGLGDVGGHFEALFGVELDARSSMLVTALKASHLCWFRKAGYRYVFSNGGQVIAGVLRSFYKEFIAPRCGPNRKQRGSLISDEVKEEVNRHCSQFANFIRPVPPECVAALPESIQAGTLASDTFLVLWDGNQIYGRLSFIRLGKHLVSVMTPEITDARCWALINLAADFELEFSMASWNVKMGGVEVEPPKGAKLVWPRANWPGKDLDGNGMGPLSIRAAAEIVTRSGQLDHNR